MRHRANEKKNVNVEGSHSGITIEKEGMERRKKVMS